MQKAIEKIKSGKEVIEYAGYTLFSADNLYFVVEIAPKEEEKPEDFEERMESAEVFDFFRAALACLLSK